VAHDVLPASGPLGTPPAANQTVDHRLRLLVDGQITGAEEHFVALASTGLWLDLEGTPTAGSPNWFATQYDYAQPWWGVYSLSAEWCNAGALEHIRVGRQAAEHGLPLTFDGASIGVRPFGPRLSVFGFGGRTVHFFETSPGWLENWVASAGITWRATESLTVELDSRLIQDRVPSQDGAERVQVTNLSYGLMATYRSDNTYAKTFARGLDEQLSHLGGALGISFPSVGMGVDGNLQAQLVTLGEVVESENPYYSLLGPSLPHVRLRLESWKELALAEETTLSLYLGWRMRQLIHGPEQTFNRNSGAVYFHTRLDGVAQKGLFIGGTAEWNYLPGSLGQEWWLALGGSAGYAGKAANTEIGTYFQRYKILYYQRVEELLDTRTVYGLVAYRVASWLELRVRYEFELLDRNLQSLFLSMRQDF
jgi:hypothetical protein